MKRIFVGQLADLDNNNPQILNTRAILSRVTSPDIEWLVPHYHESDPAVASNPNVRLIKLWRWRFWQLHKFLLYQYRVDAIFYPGSYWFDDWALRLRKACRRKVTVIATLEGLTGDEDREELYSQWAGHPVFCQRIEPKLQQKVDRMLSDADHVIAISPFLAKMGARRYGEKFTTLPLGIDDRIFHAQFRETPERFRVVGVGSFQPRKRSEVFIELAKQFPEVDFIWYGEGARRNELIKKAQARQIKNVQYPGAVPNSNLGDIYRNANLFVLPANSEGVPKVTQEAAACGLPVIIFGFYEAPTVINGVNGYVVWSDEELFARVGELVADVGRAREMGHRGAEMAKLWDWDLVAPQWQDEILRAVSTW